VVVGPSGPSQGTVALASVLAASEEAGGSMAADASLVLEVAVSSGWASLHAALLDLSLLDLSLLDLSLLDLSWSDSVSPDFGTGAEGIARPVARGVVVGGRSDGGASVRPAGGVAAVVEKGAELV
jgi:hypothetical protein